MTRFAQRTLKTLAAITGLGLGVKSATAYVARPIAQIHEFPLLSDQVPPAAKSFNYITENIFWFNSHGAFSDEPQIFYITAIFSLFCAYIVYSLTRQQATIE